jgi:two-component system chemotaxis response regulator CheY
MPTILVIDDDQLLRGVVRVVLEAAGYEVVEADDGQAGLRLHREHSPDLVLVDIFMPEQDGLEFIRELRARDPRAKIVAMSGGGRAGMLDVLKAAAAFGASRTLAKPFQPRELLTALRDLLG